LTRIGYARVSTADQRLESQTDQLDAAGCARVFADKRSGRLKQRPELERALDHLREGDALVVTRLSRLSRSVKDLIELTALIRAKGAELVTLKEGIDTTNAAGRMFFHLMAVIGEFQTDLIQENTREGLQSARARGRLGGRPRKMTPAKIRVARELYDRKEKTVPEIARELGVSASTVYAALSEGEQR
jgi:DNA invertase Pin-like site-specific DNA recombinase